MAIKIEVGGARTEVQPKKKRFSLEEVKELIGGGFVTVTKIEENPDWKHVFAYCDEDGIPVGLPLNESASQIAKKYLVGTVLFCAKGERVL
jgi:hypothetical protein